MDLLGAALNGLNALRIISPRTLVPDSRRVTNYTQAHASQIARAAGAGKMVLGRVVQTGQELVITTDFYDTRSSGRLVSATARGSFANPNALFDSLAIAVASRGLGTGKPAVDLTENYGTTSPAALRAFLVAVQLMRKLQWQTAWDSLRKATERDPTFSMAWYQLLRASWWGDAYNEFRSFDTLIVEARRDSMRLPRRIRIVLRAMQAADRGQRLEALRRADDLVAAYPEDPDAALAATDNYFHFGIASGESPEDVIVGFEHAIVLDPSVPEAYLHLVELYSALGDSSRAWQALGRLRALVPGSFKVQEIAMRMVFRGLRPNSAMDALPGPDRAGSLAALIRRLLSCVVYDPGRGLAIADSVAVFGSSSEQPRPVRLTALLSRYDLLLASGQYEQAWAVLQEAAALDQTRPDMLERVVLYQILVGNKNEDARIATAKLATFGSSGVGAERRAGAMIRYWQNALAGQLDSEDSRKLHTQGTLTRPDYAQYRDALHAGLKGLYLVSKGDTAGAYPLLLQSYEVRWPDTPQAPWAAPDRRFSLALARIEFSRGDLQSATRRLSDMLGSYGILERAEGEELRGRIEEQRGDTTAAARAYHNFIAIWQNADPELQPRVTAARAALARLERRR